MNVRTSAVIFTTLIACCSLAACKGNEQRALPSDAPTLVKEAALNCDDGNMLGCHNLGVAYWQGGGVAEDLDKARALFETACEHGAMLSCSALLDIDPETDLENSASAERIATACDQGLPAACDRWAQLLKAAGRDDEALHEAEVQCDRTPSISCVTAGQILSERGDDEGAGARFSRGCAQGIVSACRMQAELKMKGVEGEPDQEVFALFTVACRGGDGAACVRLAELYTNGIGPREDDVYARRLMDDACSYGITEACNNPSDSSP